MVALTDEKLIAFSNCWLFGLFAFKKVITSSSIVYVEQGDNDRYPR